MSDVSCRALDVFFKEAKRRGVSEDTLLKDVPYSLKHLRNKHERIDWLSFSKFMTNVGRFLSNDELADLGGRVIRNPLFIPLAAVARFLFDARDFYRFLEKQSQSGKDQFFRCVRASTLDTGVRKLEARVTLLEGYPPCPEFFWVTYGVFQNVPRLTGLPPSKVNMTMEEDGAVYSITYPAGGGLLPRLKKIITAPFVARAAAHELHETHAALQQRYDEIQEARLLLDRQATQLRTAHKISSIIHGDLDLDRALKAVTSALIDEGGFMAAAIHIDTEVEGNTIKREVQHGTASEADTPIEQTLGSHGHDLGRLFLWSEKEADASEVAQLMEYVVPTITMALDNALSFSALMDYRANLELKVEERTAQLKEAQAARQRFFANINHEIRTPLTLIKLLLAKVKGAVGDSSVLSNIEGIERNVRGLLNMVNNLLLLAAGDEGKLKLNLVPINLAAFVKGIVDIWKPAAEQAGLKLTFEGPDLCPIEIDEDAIQRSMANLLSNAIKFTPEGGRIELSLGTSDEHIELAVRDSGVGISEEARKTIFGRFEQDQGSTRRDIRGSGIGLSLVKELIEAHEGSVRVEANPQGGTVFVLTLPRNSAELDVSEEVPSKPPASALLPEDLLHQKSTAAVWQQSISVAGEHAPEATVLVAEDNPNILRSVSEILGQRYRVLQAGDGVEALELAKEHLPDLLVTDVNMPRMDGLELTKHFRAIEGNRMAPVIILTAYGDPRRRIFGFASGAVDYIVKPFEPEELQARVAAQLSVREIAVKLLETEKQVALGILSAGLAHELRNPANGVINAVQPLKTLLPQELMQPDEGVAQLIEVIETCSGQISKLSTQLLGFLGEDDFRRLDEPVGALIEQAQMIVSGDLMDVRMELQEDYSGTVWCSKSLILCVLTNLLKNAAQAAGTDGTVRVHVGKKDDQAFFDVSDSGEGVPAPLRERIFEPFFTTKAPNEGSGLGLYTARQIAHQHGGDLRVIDAGERCVFRLRLPCDALQVLKAEQNGADSSEDETISTKRCSAEAG